MTRLLALGALPWCMALVSLPLVPLWPQPVLPNGNIAVEGAMAGAMAGGQAAAISRNQAATIHVKHQDRLPVAIEQEAPPRRDALPLPQGRPLERVPQPGLPRGAFIDAPLSAPTPRWMADWLGNPDVRMVPSAEPPAPARKAERQTVGTVSVRRAEPLDVCARHGLRKVSSGRSWHCSRR